jgi:hypothetical protein
MTDVRAEIQAILGYTCDTSAPNGQVETNYIVDQWMQPRLDELVALFEKTPVPPPDPKTTEAADRLSEDLRAVQKALSFVFGRTFITPSMAENLVAALAEAGYRVSIDTSRGA